MEYRKIEGYTISFGLPARLVDDAHSAWPCLSETPDVNAFHWFNLTGKQVDVEGLCIPVNEYRLRSRINVSPELIDGFDQMPIFHWSQASYEIVRRGKVVNNNLLPEADYYLVTSEDFINFERVSFAYYDEQEKAIIVKKLYKNGFLDYSNKGTIYVRSWAEPKKIMKRFSYKKLTRGHLLYTMDKIKVVMRKLHVKIRFCVFCPEVSKALGLEGLPTEHVWLESKKARPGGMLREEEK